MCVCTRPTRPTRPSAVLLLSGAGGGGTVVVGPSGPSEARGRRGRPPTFRGLSRLSEARLRGRTLRLVAPLPTGAATPCPRHRVVGMTHSLSDDAKFAFALADQLAHRL